MKLLRIWANKGIIGNHPWTLRVYENRSIYHGYAIRWEDNHQGTIVPVHARIRGKAHALLLELAGSAAPGARQDALTIARINAKHGNPYTPSNSSIKKDC